MSNRTTRGQVESQMLENHVLNVYNTYGARLIEGHGALATKNESVNISTTVPPNTIVIFLAKPGVCMYSRAGRVIANEFFRTNAGLRTFFKGGGSTLHHAANSQTRTYMAGQQIPSIYLTFKDAVYPSIGYVWKLPLKRERVINNANMLNERTPNSTEVHNNITHGNSYLLASVLRILGPGVYIVNACLAPGNIKNNSRTGINAPRGGGWGGSKQSGASNEKRRYAPLLTPVRPPRPGSFKSTTLPRVNK